MKRKFETLYHPYNNHVDQSLSFIHDDLFTEILLRLPIKSLVRFQSVSKKWRLIITDKRFCRIKNLSQNPAIGLFFNNFSCRRDPEFIPLLREENMSTNRPPFTSHNFTQLEPHGIKYLNSCNGLLLLSSKRSSPIRYYVCNPTTKKFSMLPKLDYGNGTSDTMIGMCLAFDPIQSPHYKVVCLRGIETERAECHYKIQICSSQTGHWRNCGEPFRRDFVNNKGVYWNGAVHWINPIGYENSRYFDVESEVLHTMPMPPIPHGRVSRNNYYFGESCDHMYCIDLYRTMRIGFDVYEMKRDRSEWFVKYKVDLTELVDYDLGVMREPGVFMNYGIKVLSVVGGGQMEDSFLILQTRRNVIRYNIITKSFKVLHEYEDDSIEVFVRFRTHIGFQHIESICCVE